MATTPRSASQSASGFAQRLKDDGRQTLEQRKRSAADRVDGIAQALERTGAQFSENEPALAELTSRLATTVGNLATRLREGSIDDLVEDTRALARRNPGLFVAGGLLAGFALARFVKASGHRTLVPGGELSTDKAPTLTDEVAGNAPTQPLLQAGEQPGGQPGGQL
ncbi:MAG TPA: hypothetical protein VJQ52_14535 [Steroidobacteraceae bacterium]|nr:hypothetical protein [Steroidobacteraceae bacterium]